MIRKAILVLFTLYLGTSVWVFGGGRHTPFGSPTGAHHSNFVPFGHTRQLFHRRQQLTHQSFHRRQQLQHQLFHRRESFPHGLVHNFQFFRHRPHTVASGFTAVRIPGQWVKAGPSSTWFEERWVTIKSDEASTSPTELVPVWVTGEWMKNSDGSIWVPGHWILTGQ